MTPRRSHHLVAVLAAPPQRTPGARTWQRVNLAADALGCDSAEIVNLINVPTDSVLDISELGMDEASWEASRPALAEAVKRADAVLLGWGHSEPSGLARKHHRSQVELLRGQITIRELPAWTVGGTPRHPSWWQRYASRVVPGVEFRVGLRQSLVPPRVA